MPTTEADPTTNPEGFSEYRPLPLDEFLAEPVSRRNWAVEGVWAEGCSGIIAGPPKAGKSTLSLELAVTLATGTPFLSQPAFPLLAAPARVTYIQAENSSARVRRDLDEILVARKLGFMEDVFNPLDPEGDPQGERFQQTWDTTGSGWMPDLSVLSNPGMDLTKPADLDWLAGHARGRDYVFLDPMYMLASANPNDTGAMMDLLANISHVRDDTGCALIFTHQQSDKKGGGSPASRLIGSTFMHGWYESAIFSTRSKSSFFTLQTDNLREMGEEREVGVQGFGVGSWFYVKSAQGATDSLERRAPQTVEKETRQARLKELYAEHGDGWTQARYADELITSTASISRDFKVLKAAEGS